MGCKSRHVSIRAPRAGSDQCQSYARHSVTGFNPRSPCGERYSVTLTPVRFSGFNPRSPCGERWEAQEELARLSKFQSALPVRGAIYGIDVICTASRFQSALPVRGAIADYDAGRMDGYVSIRAPRAGSDTAGMALGGSVALFQSALPVRGAMQAGHCMVKSDLFQSALPVRGAICGRQAVQTTDPVSIRAPRAGSDGRCIYKHPR